MTISKRDQAYLNTLNDEDRTAALDTLALMERNPDIVSEFVYLGARLLWRESTKTRPLLTVETVRFQPVQGGHGARLVEGTAFGKHPNLKAEDFPEHYIGVNFEKTQAVSARYKSKDGWVNEVRPATCRMNTKPDQDEECLVAWDYNHRLRGHRSGIALPLDLIEAEIRGVFLPLPQNGELCRLTARFAPCLNSKGEIEGIGIHACGKYMVIPAEVAIKVASSAWSSPIEFVFEERFNVLKGVPIALLNTDAGKQVMTSGLSRREPVKLEKDQYDYMGARDIWPDLAREGIERPAKVEFVWIQAQKEKISRLHSDTHDRSISKTESANLAKRCARALVALAQLQNDYCREDPEVVADRLLEIYKDVSVDAALKEAPNADVREAIERLAAKRSAVTTPIQNPLGIEEATADTEKKPSARANRRARAKAAKATDATTTASPEASAGDTTTATS